MKNLLIPVSYLNETYNVSVRFRSGGDSLLFFIHGLGCSKGSFDEVWKYSGLKNYSVLLFDLPGFGESQGSIKFPYTMEAHAAVCRNVLSGFPGNCIHIVAHSMGGAVGLLLADDPGVVIKSFINIEGNLIAEDCGVSRITCGTGYNEFCGSKFMELVDSAGRAEDEGSRLWSRQCLLSDINAFYESARSLVKWSDSGLLLKKFFDLDCNKIYIYGGKNSEKTVLDRLDSIEKAVIPNSGHFPMNDNPEVFYLLLTDFINSVDCS